MSIQNKNMIYGGLCLLMLFFASTDVLADYRIDYEGLDEPNEYPCGRMI